MLNFGLINGLSDLIVRPATTTKVEKPPKVAKPTDVVKDKK